MKLDPSMKRGIIVDLFAGAGGASRGIEEALGVSPDVAINHNPKAIAMHATNHPKTQHFTSSVYAKECDPVAVCAGREVALLWASPDCRHFSAAKGDVPKSDRVRSLAWVVVDWAAAVAPWVICLENVREFQTWGPLGKNGKPLKSRKGETFNEFVGQLRALGYSVEWRILNAADYGAPTCRRRLFLVARRDGQPVRWPDATHGSNGHPAPWRTAAECIRWDLPCPSIFDRKRPLAEKTLRRIAEGVRRYVLDCAKPFIVPMTHGCDGPTRIHSIDDPLRTVTGANRGEFALCVPTLVTRSYGERKGQKPRVPGLEKPLGTAVAGGQKHALVAAILKHYGGVVGHEADRALGTITAKDHHSLMACHLTKFYGTSVGSTLDAPAGTISAQGQHHGLVAAFLIKYFGTGIAKPVSLPFDTCTSKDRAALVTVEIDGETFIIADIGMRMLTPRELARAQGFPDSYKLVGTKTEKVALIGNSVPPACARALIEANLGTRSATDGAETLDLFAATRDDSARMAARAANASAS